MSTNFYYRESAPCICCKREYPEIHLGKRAMGWKFMLHAYDRSDTWQSIKAKLLTAHEIRDEYWQTYSAEEMIKVVETWCVDGKAHCDYYPDNSWYDPEGYVLTIGEWS